MRDYEKMIAHSRETFLRDVANHQMTIQQDSGVYRHVVFSRPDTVIQRFGLVTWPGYLAYYGDMGEFMFARINDMFRFFRGDTINPCYWGSKCYAEDRGRMKEFCEDTFKEHVLSYLERAGYSDAEKDELRRAFDLHVLGFSDERESYDAVFDFEHRWIDSEREPFIFEDLSYECTRYTTRFLWCCNAIQWGISQYDDHSSKEAAA